MYISMDARTYEIVNGTFSTFDYTVVYIYVFQDEILHTFS